MRGVDQLGKDEGTARLELLMTEKGRDWAQLPTYLSGPSESWVAAERATTQRLKAAWVPLQTRVKGCPEVGLVVRALGAVAAVDP